MTLGVNREAAFWILLNEGSGNDNKKKTQETISRVFEATGQRCEFICVSDPDQLSDEAKKIAKRIGQEGGALIVAGGDGSISSVASIALEAQCPFGVIPLGTFNYFARANHVSEDPETAAQELLHSQITPTQVGLLNGKVFLVNASVGLYPELLEDREDFKRRFGRSRLVAFGSALVTLFREHRQLSLELVHDGVTEKIRTPTLVVANNRLQLEQIGVSEKPVTHGQLMAISVKSDQSMRLIYLLFSAALGRLGKETEVTSRPIHKLVAKPGKRYGAQWLKVALDGEVERMKTPLNFQVAEKSLQLLKPPSKNVGEAL